MNAPAKRKLAVRGLKTFFGWAETKAETGVKEPRPEGSAVTSPRRAKQSMQLLCGFTWNRLRFECVLAAALQRQRPFNANIIED